MAWTYNQNFNSLSTGNLNGQDSWSGSTSPQVENSTVYEGANAVSDAVGANQDHDITRAITAITEGSVYFVIRVASTTQADGFFVLKEGGTNRMYIRSPGYSGGAAIHIYDNGTWRVVASSLSANTWYPVNMEFDNVGQPNKYRARVYSSGAWGSWSSWYTVNGGSYTNVDTIRLNWVGENSTTDTKYIDTISSTDPTLPTFIPWVVMM